MSVYKQAGFDVRTSGRSLTDITAQVREAVHAAGIRTGLCNVFIRHTSASLIVSENADPDVLVDLETYLSDLVPDADPRYLHTAEGPDDMAAHVRSALTLTEVSIPVIDGSLGLGTWQGIYLWEHRHRAHARRLIVTVHGEC